MKKIALFAIVILLAQSLIFAQKGKELAIGVGGSVSSVWIQNQNFYGEPEVDYAPKMGYAGSINLTYHFTENIGVATEFQYSFQGQKYEGKQTINGVKYDVERDINLTYFNVPLFFKYAFGENKTKFRVLLGPQLGVLLDATQDYTRNGKKLGTTIENLEGMTFVTDAKNIKNRFEKYDIGVAFDIGADIHITHQFVFNSGFRMNYGFNDINAEEYRLNDIDGEYSPSHNFWAGIFVGISYKIDVEGYSQRSF